MIPIVYLDFLFFFQSLYYLLFNYQIFVCISIQTDVIEPAQHICLSTSISSLHCVQLNHERERLH